MIDLQSLGQQLGVQDTSSWGQSTPFAEPQPASAKPNFLTSSAHSAANIVAGAAGWLGHAITAPVTGLGHDITGLVEAHQQNQFNNQAMDQLSTQLQQYSKAYRAGKISTSRYQALLKDHQQQLSGIGENIKQSSTLIPSKGKVTSDVLGTAVTPLAFGRLTATGAEGALGAAEKVAGAVTKEPGTVVNRVTKALPKNALIEQPLAQSAVQTAQDVKHGDLKDAAANAALIAGAPLAIGGASKALPKIASLFKDEQNFSNSLKFQNGTIGSVLQGYKTAAEAGDKNAATAYKKLANQAKVAIAHFQAEGKTPGDIATYHSSTPGHIPVQNMTVEDFLAQNHDLAQATKLAQKQAANGDISLTGTGKPVPKDQLPLVGAGRFDQSVKSDLINRLESAGSPADRMSILEQDAKAKMDYTRNPSVFRAVQAASMHDDPQEMATAIKAINGTRGLAAVKPTGSPTLDALMAEKNQTALPGMTNAAKPPKELPGGYIPIIKPEGAAGFVKPSEVSDTVLSADKGPLASVTRVLRGIGLSPEGADQGKLRGALIDNLNTRFAGTEFEGKGKQVLNALTEAMNRTKGVYDPRMLRVGSNHNINIEDALQITKDQAKTVSSAIKGAYSDLPLGTRSLGEKIADKVIENVPGMSTYLKAQGYGRFTMNPFFWVKQGIKSEFIAQAETGGKTLNAGRMLNQVLGTAPKQETQNLLKSDGWFSKYRQSGEQADFFGNLLPGEVDKNLKQADIHEYIRQAMGQAAEQFAKNQGTTVKDIMEGGGQQKEQLDSLLQMIVGYPKDGYLSSNLAKSLNVLVFPSRFETKVGLAAGKFLAKQPPAAQAAFVMSLMHAQDFLKSNAGKKWQQDNAQLLGALDYFSPTHTFESVMKTLGSRSLGDLGSIGGMPFGVITTILSHQGVGLPSQLAGSQDINPATGQPYAEKLPIDTKGRIQQGLIDFTGSLFSYPGATAGLPSKNSVIQNLPGLKQNSKDFKTIGGTVNTTKTTVPEPVGISSGSLSRPVATIKKFNFPAASTSSSKSRRVKTVPKNLQILP